MANINSVTNYIILKLTSANENLILLKLQKLLYYCQAWHLVYFDRPLFNAKFQAWVHGPVCRAIYDRFKDTYSLYSHITSSEIPSSFNQEQELTCDERGLIDSVLEAYAGLTGTQLEQMTHSEGPWIEARQGLPPAARSEKEISEDSMRSYYGARVRY